MAIARTGVFVDDYLEYSSTLAAELQRLLSTMRELDERAQGIICQARDQTKYYVGMHSQCSKKAIYEDDESELEKMKKEIEANQENALSLCTEKVVLAKQAYDLIESHVKRLDEDLNQFAEDLKQEGKIPPDEPAILPPLPMVSREEKRRGGYVTPQSKRIRERVWDRERDMDLELMPPPGSQKKSGLAAIDVDQPIDPNEPTYCVCHQVSFGDMIACDNENPYSLDVLIQIPISSSSTTKEEGFTCKIVILCQIFNCASMFYWQCEGGEWFHYSCVGLTPETRFKGKWFCPTCRQQQ